jgi:hypothetical protein
MTIFPPGLVWLASYPKSGNTWMRVLLANLSARSDRAADINRLSDEQLLITRSRFADDMLTDGDLLRGPVLREMRRRHSEFVAETVSRPFFCKTHDRFDPAVLGRKARAALYMVRDPRDVAISLSHHGGTTIDKAITQMVDPALWVRGPQQLRYLLGDWGGHVSSWIDATDCPVKIVRYEDLLRDTAKVVAAIVDFLGADIGPGAVQGAVAHSRLEELQRQEEANGFREARPNQLRFFRSGRVGEWHDMLTEAQVQRIQHHFAPAMTRLAYPLA